MTDETTSIYPKSLKLHEKTDAEKLWREFKQYNRKRTTHIFLMGILIGFVIGLSVILFCI